jgi:hypothetical protein
LTREFYSASTIFVKLSTPKEDKTRKFIEEKGGGRICIENDQLLAEMIRLSGEGVAGVTLEHTGDRLKDLAAARRKLIKELEEDLDMELTRNLIIFRRKLEMLHGDFGTLFPEEDYVSLPLSTRPYDRVIDTVSIDFLLLLQNAYRPLIGLASSVEEFGMIFYHFMERVLIILATGLEEQCQSSTFHHSCPRLLCRQVHV